MSLDLKIASFIRQLRTSLFVRQVSATFITKLAIITVGIASSIITARYLGPEGKGVLAVLMTIIGTALQFGNLGLHSANTYYVAREREILPRVVSNTFWLSMVGGSAISLITLGILFLRANLTSGLPFPFILIALIAVPFGLLFMLGQNILLGIQKVKDFNVLEFAKRLITFLMVAVSLMLFKQGAGTVVTIEVLLAISFSLIIMKVLLPKGNKICSFDVPLFRQMVRYGFKAYLAALFSFLVIRFDMLMVNSFLGADEAGVYSIAAHMADLLYMLPVTIGMIFFPKISEMNKGKWEFTKKTTWITAIIMILICLMAAVVARPLINLFYGKAFLGAAEALWWLLPGIFVLSINTIFMNFFAGQGMPIIVVISPFIALMVNIVLNIKFIPLLGIKGAAFTSSVAYVIMLTASIIYINMRKDFIKE